MRGTLYRQQLKLYARQTVVMNGKICMRASTAVVAIALVLTMIQQYFGHPLVYMLLSTEHSGAIYSGLQVTAAGLAAALRFDTAGIIFAIQMTWKELGTSLAENLIVLLITVPVTYGALEHFFGLFRRQAYDLKSLFRWYLDLRLVLRGMTLEVLVSFAEWGLRLLGVIPGLCLYTAAASAAEGSALATLGSMSGLLLLLGLAGAWLLSCQLEPARYLLADRPELGPLGAIREGWRRLKGRRVDYFWFSLSFIGWDFLTMLTYGLGNMYLLPYRSLASALYLGLYDVNSAREEEGISHV